MLHLIAVLFLLEDYATGLRYAQSDRYIIPNNYLYKATRLRLQALLLEQLYIK